MQEVNNKTSIDIVSEEPNPRAYHEVWIPLGDIYRYGETEAFKQLSRGIEGERNLIIFPSEFSEELWPYENGEVKKVPGSRALSYLKERAKLIRSDKDYSLFELDSGLDIAYIKQSGFLQKPDLEERVIREFGKPPALITTNAGKFIDFRAYGLKIEEPKDFILVDANIVNRGLLIGPDSLSEILYTEQGRLDREFPNRHDKLASLSLEQAEKLVGFELFMNQFIQFIGNPPGYARVTADFRKNENGDITDKRNPRVELVKIPSQLKYHVGDHFLESMVGIKPEGVEQYLAVQYGILNPDVELAFICGAQGSGKTIISYSAAVDLILTYPKEVRTKRGINRDGGLYDQLVIFRPNDPVGGKRREPGFLPGDLWQKTKTLFRGFEQAHKKAPLLSFPFEQMVLHPEFDTEYGDKRIADKVGSAYLPPRNEAIGLYSFSDIRGVTYERTLMIIDEAQNFTPFELKTLLSRLGRHSKCLVLGDPNQLDNQNYCTENYNGLTSAIKYYLPFENTFLFSLTKNRRTATSRRSISWPA